MSGRPEKLGRALKRALRELNMDQRVKESRAMALWPDVVGEVTAAKTRPVSVNRGVMTVAVASSAWANQLNLLKGRFMAALAERVGPGVVTDLRWRVLDPAAQPEEGVAPPAFAPPPRAATPPLDEAEKGAIAREVGAIADPLLAARLREVLEAQAGRRKRLREQGWEPCQRCGVLHDGADRPYMRAKPGEADGMPEAVDPLAFARMCPPCRLELGTPPIG